MKKISEENNGRKMKTKQRKEIENEDNRNNQNQKIEIINWKSKKEI